LLSKSLKPLKVGEGKGYDSNYSLRAISELPSRDATVLAPSDVEGGSSLASGGLPFTSDPLGSSWSADLDAEELDTGLHLSELLCDSFYDSLVILRVADEVICSCTLNEGSVHIGVISEERLVITIAHILDLGMGCWDHSLEGFIVSLEALECVVKDDVDHVLSPLGVSG
jgi:hypothetical protein